MYSRIILSLVTASQGTSNIPGFFSNGLDRQARIVHDWRTIGRDEETVGSYVGEIGGGTHPHENATQD